MGIAENADNNHDSMKGKQNKRLTMIVVEVPGDTVKRDPRGMAGTVRKKKKEDKKAPTCLLQTKRMLENWMHKSEEGRSVLHPSSG